MNQFIGMIPNEPFDKGQFYEWAKEFCDENGLITFQHYHIGKIQGHQCYFSGCAICWYQDLYEYPASKLYIKCANLNCENDMEKTMCFICKNSFCPQCLFKSFLGNEQRELSSISTSVSEFTLLNSDSNWQCQSCLYSLHGDMFKKSQKEIEKLLS